MAKSGSNSNLETRGYCPQCQTTVAPGDGGAHPVEDSKWVHEIGRAHV